MLHLTILVVRFPGGTVADTAACSYRCSCCCTISTPNAATTTLPTISNIYGAKTIPPILPLTPIPTPTPTTAYGVFYSFPIKGI